MRKAIALAFIFATASAAVSQAVTSRPVSEDVRLISSYIELIAKAFVSRDPEPFERLYLSEFVSVRGRPVYNAREQLAAMVRSDALAKRAKKPLDFETVSFESDDPTIRVIGDVAIVNSLKRNEWKYRDSKCLTQYQSTDVWVRTGSEWRLAAGAANTIQCDPMPWHPPHPAVASIPEKTTPPNTNDPAESEIETMLQDIAKASETGDTAAAHGRHFLTDYVFINAEAVRADNPSDLIEAIRAGAHPSQRTTIEDEAIFVYGDAAVYVFGARTRPRPGSIERAKTVYYLTVLVRSEGRWRFAAAHAVKS
ncbi:MAG: nuclear transport factor 2 family protein [Pyrinomonadaceae bacterium]|nr:nuclear transport factor 2 family protein [Pyrinomonadaceae bacterium]